MDKCVHFDGCCATHGPCFELSKEGKAQACEGWPCPEGYVNWESEGGYVPKNDTPKRKRNR